MRTFTQRAAGSGRPTRWRTWLPLVGLAGLVWLAGCKTTEKPQKQAQEKPSAAAAAKPGAERSAPAGTDRPRTAQLRASEMPAQRGEGAPPPAQPRAAVRTAPQSPGTSTDNQLSDAERGRMREYILQKIKEREAAGEAKPAEAEQPTSAPTAAESVVAPQTGDSPAEATYADVPAQEPLPPIRQGAQPAKPAQPTAPAQPTTAQQTGKTEQPTGEAAAGGCGQANPGGLPAPAEGSPQPKFACKNPKIELAEVWTGESPTFKFVVANEGEGALQIKLKKP